MFGPVVNGALPNLSILGFFEIFSLELKVWQIKTDCVSKFFISSVFTSDNQCQKFDISNYLRIHA